MSDLPPLIPGGALFLDFDGTLVDIAPRPDAVRMVASTVRDLRALQARLGGAVALISGRPVAEIDAHLAPACLPVAGQHGAERRSASGAWHRVEVPGLSDVLPPMRALADAHPGLVLERKSAALALHYRNAPGLAEACRRVMDEAGRALPGMRLLEGKMVIELKPAAVDKGRALEAFMGEVPFAGRRPWFFGDDVTDEAGFESVQRLGGVAVKVGPGDSAARWRLPGPDAVRAWLAEAAA